MRYAREVEGLMASHPGREFKMIEIRRYVEATQRIDRADRLRREAARQGVIRVLDALIDCGCVLYVKERQSTSRYIWKL